jgi:hypothetical protein
MNWKNAMSILALVVVALPAQAEHELVGFTTTAVAGDHRIANMTTLCQNDFGSPARMCTDSEILQTTNWPSGLAGSAWVHPDLRGGLGAVYGVGASGFIGDPLTLSCNNWSEGTSSGAGLLYSAPGGALPAFVAVGCQTQQSVACCVPAPTSMASVAGLGTWGQAGLAVLLLLAATAWLLAVGRVQPGRA